jgi:hypothetical protein
MLWDRHSEVRNLIYQKKKKKKKVRNVKALLLYGRIWKQASIVFLIIEYLLFVPTSSLYSLLYRE